MLPSPHLSQPLPAGPAIPGAAGSAPPGTAPTFYLTRRQPLGPAALLLGAACAVLALSSVMFALGHTGRTNFAPGSPGSARSPGAAGPGAPAGDNSDQTFDTIVLGDAGDAPTPARPGDHVSDVHPFAIVHLPRFGDETGLIPDTPAGRLLYAWLAAFNQASYPALGSALPTADLARTAAAEMQLRQDTGGFALLSAKEFRPGLLVFRLRDQTTRTETLGTLELRPNARPAAIQSFSLRAVNPDAHAAPSARPLS